MLPQLGFFEQFRGGDAVLLATTAQGARELAQRLQIFVQSSAPSMPIEAEPVPGRATRIAAVRSPDVTTQQPGFRLLCGPMQISDIAGKLHALAGVASGHQYFDLLDCEVEFLVSVGEGTDY